MVGAGVWWATWLRGDRWWGDTRQDDNTNRDGRGQRGTVTGLDLIYRADCVGLLPWGDGLRATPQLISVLTETAHRNGGRGGLWFSICRLNKYISRNKGLTLYYRSRMWKNQGVRLCDFSRLGGLQLGAIMNVYEVRDGVRRFAFSLAPSDMDTLAGLAPELRVYWLRDMFGVSLAVAFKGNKLLGSGVI